jgi:hypothetical protein
MNFRLVAYAVFAYLASASILLFMVAPRRGRPPSPTPAADPDRMVEIRHGGALPRSANPDALELIRGHSRRDVGFQTRRYAERAESDTVMIIRGGHGTDLRMLRRR